MLRRPLRIVTLLLIAGGIPYAWHTQQLATVWQRFVSGANEITFDSAFDAWQPPRAAAADPVPPLPSPNTLGGTQPSEPLAKVLSFDITQPWVMQRWPRISTLRTEPNLVGLRVPYVSGTQLTDVAGSLTYYFDERGGLRRLTLFGQTGDPQHLLNVVHSSYLMRSEPNLRAGLYVARWNGVPTSALWITHPDVVRADRPYSRYEFKLEINRPSAGYGLSREFTELLGRDGRHQKPFW